MTARPIADLVAIGAPALPEGYFYRVHNLGHLSGVRRVFVEVRQVRRRYPWSPETSRRVASASADVLKSRATYTLMGKPVRSAVENAVAEAARRACFIRGVRSNPKRWLRDEMLRAVAGEYR